MGFSRNQEYTGCNKKNKTNDEKSRMVFLFAFSTFRVFLWIHAMIVPRDSVRGLTIVYNKSMDKILCPSCHIEVRPTDYFCFNCGKNLQEKPPSITVESQILLYLGSVFLPPMGIIWGLKYLRRPDQKSRTVGWVAVILTLVCILLYAKWIFGVMDTVNKEVNQFNSMQGF